MRRRRKSLNKHRQSHSDAPDKQGGTRVLVKQSQPLKNRGASLSDLPYARRGIIAGDAPYNYAPLFLLLQMAFQIEQKTVNILLSPLLTIEPQKHPPRRIFSSTIIDIIPLRLKNLC